MEEIFLVLRTVVLGGAVFILCARGALGLRSFDDLLGGVLPWWTAILGWILMMVGAPLSLWCLSLFVLRGRGTPVPFDPPRHLVVQGPYRYCRNPMAVGAGLLFLGFGLQQQSPSIALFVPIGAPLISLMVVFYEEPTLRKQFGSEYREYCLRTPRWIPKFTRKSARIRH